MDDATPTNRKRILLVDDENSILFSMQYILRDTYEILIASGGERALDMVTQEDGNIDLIICDLSMPKVNGVHFYLYVTEQYPDLKEHILFMTGGPFGDYVNELGLTKDHPCLKKPFSKEELLLAVERFFVKS